MYIHAILRENSAALTIPTSTPFSVIVSDPLGREVKRSTIKTNEYGSFSIEYQLPKDASLGMYSVNVAVADSTEYIENSWSNFQVEVFKNPTFTASIELKSPDIVDEAIKNLKKIPNNDPYTPWYNEVYTGNFTIEGIVRAKYYNGADIKNTTYTYKVYRSEYFPDNYW